jgi:hypothetical protein
MAMDAVKYSTSLPLITPFLTATFFLRLFCPQKSEIIIFCILLAGNIRQFALVKNNQKANFAQ